MQFIDGQHCWHIGLAYQLNITDIGLAYTQYIDRLIYLNLINFVITLTGIKPITVTSSLGILAHIWGQPTSGC